MIRLLQMYWARREEREMLQEAVEILAKQREMLVEASQEIEEWKERTLLSQRAVRDLAITFRAHQDSPDIDITDDLDELVEALKDSVAQFEEYFSF